MAMDATSRRSRRAVLVGGIGGIAALVASALGRPPTVRAADGEAVTVGGTFEGVTPTTITNHAAGGVAVAGHSDAPGGLGIGIYGESPGRGVTGQTTVGRGVNGIATAGVGVFGGSTTGTGVQGFSGSDDTPAAPAKTAVFGYAAQDQLARGVTGQTTSGYGVSGNATTGTGVRGESTTGYGVHGSATSGPGVIGFSVTGTGMQAYTSGIKIGTALQTVGRVRFDKSVGIATIAAGRRSVKVTPGIDLLASSAVVATLMGSAGGTTAVRCVIVDIAKDTFTIYLTANATTKVGVAWHVFG
jgi:hypothetical protein